MARSSTSGQGRPKGTPNKATGEAREAIAIFVNNNAGRLQEWLDKVADGVKDDSGGYTVPPNPEKAFSLFQSVVEYHIPKLARTDNITTLQGELPVMRVEFLNGKHSVPGES